MFLPKGVNLRTKSSWAGDGDTKDFSRDDSQVLIVDGEVRVWGERGREEEGWAMGGAVLGVGWGWGPARVNLTVSPNGD